MMMLVCDDMETDRQNLRKILTELGHVVEVATNGKEAFDKAKANKPAVVFLDVVMPDQDGFATCRKLKQEPATSAIPVVMVTSKGTQSDRFWAEKQGANGHVAKPYTKDDIATALKSLGK